MKKICHLTSVHPRYDTRIFVKECGSLAESGYDVNLVVADGLGDELRRNVRFYDVGKPKNRLNRFWTVTDDIYKKALELNADVYHLHDPELIPIGVKLKRHGKKVVFDAHEDVPKQILSKTYINKPARVLLSQGFSVYERWACAKFDAVVAATPFIEKKYLEINPRTINVSNFPILGELSGGPVNWLGKESQVCYVGGISLSRGIKEIVAAMEVVKADVRLQIAGVFPNEGNILSVKQQPGWESVDELGFLDRDAVRSVLERSIAGLVTLHPLINYQDALPIKMFEYMSAGLPVIASKFPLWESIVQGHKCGICVDPLRPSEIAHAIDYLITNPEEAKKMGENGQKAVEDIYNWQKEKLKLIDLYKSLLSTQPLGSM